MPKLIQSKDYDLKRNYYVIADNCFGEDSYYQSSKNLTTWTRFLPTNKPFNDVKSNIQSCFYRGQIEFYEQRFQGCESKRFRNAIKPLNQQSYVAIDASLLVVNDGYVDKPFSFSTWIKFDESATSGTFFCKQQEEATVNSKQLEFFVDVDEQKLSLMFYDRNASLNVPKTIRNEYNLSNAFDGSWHHLMVSFDPSQSSNAKVSFYLDGSLQSTIDSSDDGYEMMRDFDIPYVLGMSYSVFLIFVNPLNPTAEITPYGSSPTGFNYAETALWNTNLTANDARTIFRSIASKVRLEESGFLSESPRLQIRNIDHATGSYPSNSSHGMPDFNGRYDVNFNDESSIDFISNYAEASLELFQINANDPTNYIASGKIQNISIDLTGYTLDGPVSKSFSFVTDPSKFSQSMSDPTKIVLASQKVENLISALASKINSNSMGLEARAIKNVLRLRQHLPSIGSFELGNQITVQGSTIDVERIVKNVKQFQFFGSNLIWPSMLPNGSVWSNANAVSPHRLDGVQAPGRMLKGTSDSHVKFTPGQDILPFNEHRLPNDDADPFYANGTPEDDLPGFSARLSSKSSFIIDINPMQDTEIYFSTGSEVVEACSGLAYFNFGEKRWELVGNDQELDFISSDPTVATNSMLSVMPSTFWGNFPNLADIPLSLNNIRHLGKPSSFAGFPLASKFDANANQLVSMKDFIKAPFLVEKIEIQVNGVLGAYPAYESRAEFVDLGDIRYTNVSGQNNLGRAISIYYEWTEDEIPIIEVDDATSDNYIITVKFLAGVVTAQQILDAFDDYVEDPGDVELNLIVKVEIKPDGNPSNVQYVE